MKGPSVQLAQDSYVAIQNLFAEYDSDLCVTCAHAVYEWGPLKAVIWLSRISWEVSPLSFSQFILNSVVLSATLNTKTSFLLLFSFNVTDTIVVVGCVDTFCFFSPSFFFYWLVCLCARISPGLCALSISNDNCYLAYPGSATIGEVQVFDTVNLVGEPRQWYFMCSCF